jgi:hypothetical protein
MILESIGFAIPIKNIEKIEEPPQQVNPAED